MAQRCEDSGIARIGLRIISFSNRKTVRSDTIATGSFEGLLPVYLHIFEQRVGWPPLSRPERKLERIWVWTR